MFIKHLKYNFTFNFFQKNEVPFFCKSVTNKFTNTDYKNNTFEGLDNIKNNIYEVKFIPEYLQLNYPTLPSNYKIVKFKRVENFLVNLENFTSVEGYLESVMGPKSRSQLRRRIHRLENCFDVNYQFYFGENITQQKYDELFNQLELFIDKRFKQRGDHFSLAKKLSEIRGNTYEMILKKKASVFVITANNKIIDVCLSYHYQNIMHHLIRSYDIDYSKFWLGQVDIYQQLKICFKYNFTLFDFMWGELIYKKRWSNSITIYEHHFIYKNSNPLKTPLIKFIIQLYKWHDNLKAKSLYKAIKNRFTRPKIEPENKFIKTVKIKNTPSPNHIIKINIEKEIYRFLRKTIYDFQYLNFEETKNIEVFKLLKTKNIYIIKGTKEKLKFTVSKT